MKGNFTKDDIWENSYNMKKWDQNHFKTKTVARDKEGHYIKSLHLLISSTYFTYPQTPSPEGFILVIKKISYGCNVQHREDSQ